ncbi:hypothetical protein EON81_12910 [bacterium]|nr:MAG: hypothetical protein EON81_12910 [bacterium]
MVDLEGLVPPPSVVRLIEFLGSLGVTLEAPEGTARPIGIGIGHRSLSMARNLADRITASLTLLSLTGYTLTFGTRDVQDLRHWLVRAVVASERFSDPAHRPSSTQFEEAPTLSRSRRAAAPFFETDFAAYSRRQRSSRPISEMPWEEKADEVAVRQSQKRSPEVRPNWIESADLPTLLLAQQIVARSAMRAEADAETGAPTLRYRSPILSEDRHREDIEDISNPRPLSRRFLPNAPEAFEAAVSAPVRKTNLAATPALAFAQAVADKATGTASPIRSMAGGPIGQAAQAAFKAWPAADPRYGNLTLVAPPLRIASPKGERAGVAAELDWPQLQRRMTPFGFSEVEQLHAMLPAGTRALYPALPEATLGPSAFNVPLNAKAIESLIVDGFGPLPPAWADSPAMRLPMAPAMPLVARFSPYGTPGDSLEPEEEHRSANTVMFGGIPVSTPPRLTDDHPLAQTAPTRVDLRSAPSPMVRPWALPTLTQRISPAFGNLRAEPDVPAWSRAPHTAPIGISAAPSMMSRRDFTTPTYMPLATRVAPAPIAMPGGAQIRMSAPLFSPGPSFSPASRALEHTPGISMPSAVSTPLVTPTRIAVRPSHQTPTMPAPSAPILGNTGGTISPPTPAVLGEDRIGSRPETGAPPSLPMVRGGMPSFARPISLDASIDVHSSSYSMPSASTVIANRPTMPLASLSPREESLVVQRSGSAPAAPISSPTSAPAASATGGGGGKADDVNLLAGEVWSILKRRLAFEAQRAGRSQRI